MNIIKRNIGLKLLALILSFFSCLVVHMLSSPGKEDTLSHRVYTLPINFVAPSEEFIHSSETKEVVVTLRGSLSLLDRITPELVSAEVNLSGRDKAGNSLEAVEVMAPGGVVVSNVDPAYIWVKVAKRVAKQVPIRVALQGQVESGFSVGNPEVAPEKLRIVGADNKVESVVALRAPLAVSHASGTFSAVVQTLLPVDVNGLVVSGIDVDKASVCVTVPVYALKRAMVSLDKISVDAKPGKGYTLSVEPKNVLCEGLTNDGVPAKIFTQKQMLNFDGKELVVTVPLDIPSGVSLASGVSDNVVVKVTPKQKDITSAKVREKK